MAIFCVHANDNFSHLSYIICLYQSATITKSFIHLFIIIHIILQCDLASFFLYNDLLLMKNWKYDRAFNYMHIYTSFQTTAIYEFLANLVLFKKHKIQSSLSSAQAENIQSVWLSVDVVYIMWKIICCLGLF